MTEKQLAFCEEMQDLINARPDLEDIAGAGYGMEFVLKIVPRVTGTVEAFDQSTVFTEDRGGISAWEWKDLAASANKGNLRVLAGLYKKNNEFSSCAELKTNSPQHLRRYLRIHQFPYKVALDPTTPNQGHSCKLKLVSMRSELRRSNLLTE